MSSSNPGPRGAIRDPWLDAVRGLSVLAMVFGHTLDLTLDDGVRGAPLVTLYWSFRGLTAPVFLLVAGWALVASLRSADPDVLGRRLRRAALVLGLGYVLHWPGLAAARAMAAEGTLWPHLLAFDALPCIGWCIVGGVLLLGLLPHPVGRIGAMGTLVLWVPFVAPLSWTLGSGSGWPWHGVLGHPAARFPLVPWASFFFLGGTLSMLLPRLQARRHRTMGLLLAGGLLLLLLEQTGLETWAPASPWPAFYRMGQALLALGLLSGLPIWLLPGLVTLGRSSLGVYVAHLVLLYGWAGDPGLAGTWAHRLTVPGALGLAVAVLTGAVAMARGIPAAVARVEENMTSRWQQPSAGAS